MQLTWHLLVIIASVLIGVCLYQKGEITLSMSAEQAKDAKMYRTIAYLLWGVAVVVAVYYYYILNNTQKATMCGVPHKAYMCGLYNH